MEKEYVFEKLKGILKTELNVQADITMDTALFKESILDSLEFMNYLTHVEEEFNTHINDEHVETYQLGVINNMVTYINNIH